MKPVLRMALAAPLALIAACKQEAPAPQASASASAASADDLPATRGNVAITNGKLVLPAVKGRPGAAYFMASNSSDKPETITAVAVEGADKTEMHETKGGEMTPLATVDLPAGDMVMFERGGKHVMAFGLAPTIKAGDSVKLTVTFAGGATQSEQLQVEAAGGAAVDHGAMR